MTGIPMADDNLLLLLSISSVLLFVSFPTEVSCSENDGSKPKLLYTNTIDIKILDTATGSTTTVDSGNTYALFVDYDINSGYIYWSDMKDGTISRKKFPSDGSSKEVIVDVIATSPVGIVVDSQNNHLYWIDRDQGKLSRVDLDGSNNTDILTGLTFPLPIALDARNGWLYYSDGCSSVGTVIGKCKLDGSNKQTIIADDFNCVQEITLDLVEDKIYWTDSNLGKLKSANFDGSNVQLHASGLSIPLGINIYGDNIYFTEWYGKMYVMPKSTGSSKVLIHSDNPYMMGVKRMELDGNCMKYIVKKNEEKRSTGFTMDPATDESLTDEFLTTNWFRFISDNGDEMSTNPPGVYLCGAKNPIWLNGTLPTKSVGNTAGIACMQTEDDACQLTISINITNCGTYFVYYLTNTPSNSSFCIGDGPVKCPDGLSSESGYYPGCDSTFPNTTVAPVVEAVLIEGPIQHIPNIKPSPSLVPVFKCSFQEPVDGNYIYDIYWYINGNDVTHFKNVPFSTIGDTVLRDSHWTESYHLNMQVHCAVRIRFSRDELPGPFIQSPVFDAGLYPKKYEYTVIEGESINISMTSTVPVACLSTADNFVQHCTRAITVFQPKLKEDTSVCYNSIANKDILFKTQHCGIEISALNWNETKYFQVYGFSDGLYNFKDRSTYIRLATSSYSPFHDILKNIQIPEIKVSVIDKDAVLTNRICQSYNDPHITTCDGRLYHFMEVGEFVIYRNDNGPYWVHALLTNCGFGWTGSSCHCGVAIRSRNSLFVLRTCEKISRTDKYLLQQPVIELNQCDDSDMLIETSGNEYKITLPIKTEITIRISAWSKFIGMISIKPSIYDINIAKGLCGVPSLTKDPTDDFTHRHDGPMDDSNNFANSWRITESMTNEQLFIPKPEFLNNQVVIYVNDFVESGRLERYCTCEREAESKDSIEDFYTLQCNLTETSMYCSDDSQSDGNTINAFPTSCSRTSRKKRSLGYGNDNDKSDSDDVADVKPLVYDEDVNNTDTIPKTFRNGWTEASAYQHCQEKISEAVPTELYSGIVEVNTEHYIQSCVKDIELVGDTLFLQDTISSMMVLILTEAKRNESLYITKTSNDSMSILDQLLGNMCPNNCSDNGNCSGGTCKCLEGYIGEDCSQEISTPPADISIPENGLCSLETRACKRTNIYGRFPSQIVWYQLKHFQVQKNGAVFSSGEQIGQAQYRNGFLVSVNLPSSRRKRSVSENVMADGYQISLSNDNKIFGDPVIIIVYDEGCYMCNSTSITCTVLDACIQSQMEEDEGNSITPIAVGITIGFLVIVTAVVIFLIYKYKNVPKTVDDVISDDQTTHKNGWLNRRNTTSSLNIEITDERPETPVELFLAQSQSCPPANHKRTFNPATLKL